MLSRSFPLRGPGTASGPRKARSLSGLGVSSNWVLLCFHEHGANVAVRQLQARPVGADGLLLQELLEHVREHEQGLQGERQLWQRRMPEMVHQAVLSYEIWISQELAH